MVALEELPGVVSKVYVMVRPANLLPKTGRPRDFMNLGEFRPFCCQASSSGQLWEGGNDPFHSLASPYCLRSFSCEDNSPS